jgi:RecA-family ATPase
MSPRVISDTARAALALLDSMPRAQFSMVRPPEPRFILPGLREGGGGLIVGPGGVGKSFLTLEILRGYASGDGVALHQGACLYTPAEMGEPGPCGAIFGEDDPEILAMRLHELAAARGADEAEIRFLNQAIDLRSGVGVDLSLLVKNAQGQLVPGPFYAALKLFCEGKKLVVLDPLLFLAGDMDEKDNGAMGALMRLITRLAYETGCAILVIHHVAKAGGEDGREEAARARGASSITTSVRLQIDLRAPTATEMMDMGIDENERGFYVRVAQVKANYAAQRKPRWLYRQKGGVLGAIDVQSVPQAKPAAPAGRRQRGGQNGAI